MAWRFRRSLSFLGLFRLNFSRRGVGLSVGVPGFRVGIGPGGARATASLPGTGLSFSKRLSRRANGFVCGAQRNSGKFCVKQVRSHGGRCWWHRGK